VGAPTYTELEVWKLADDVRRRVSQLTSGVAFEHRDLWWVKDQMRRSAHSACANIAEGFGRYNPRDFARFLRISRASLVELSEHLREPLVTELFPGNEAQQLVDSIDRARRASARLIRYLVNCQLPPPGAKR